MYRAISSACVLSLVVSMFARVQGQSTQSQRVITISSPENLTDTQVYGDALVGNGVNNEAGVTTVVIQRCASTTSNSKRPATATSRCEWGPDFTVTYGPSTYRWIYDTFEPTGSGLADLNCVLSGTGAATATDTDVSAGECAYTLSGTIPYADYGTDGLLTPTALVSDYYTVTFPLDPTDIVALTITITGTVTASTGGVSTITPPPASDTDIGSTLSVLVSDTSDFADPTYSTDSFSKSGTFLTGSSSTGLRPSSSSTSSGSRTTTTGAATTTPNGATILAPGGMVCGLFGLLAWIL